MTNQKYCRNCGEPNLPDAKFCASCGKAFVSAAASPSLTARSATPSPDKWKTPWNQSSQSSQPRTTGVSREMIVVGIVVLFILLTLGCVAVAVMTPNSTPKPTAVDSDVQSAVNSMVSGKGYSIVTPLQYSTTDSHGDRTFTVTFAKSEYLFNFTIVKVTNSANSVSDYNSYVSSAKAHYSGSTEYLADYSEHWSGRSTSGEMSVIDIGIADENGWIIQIITSYA